MQARIVPWLEKSKSEDGDKPPARIMTLVWNLLYIIYSFEVGIVLLCLPWLNIWENNYLLYLYPQIRSVVANPFFKGAVLGLGIVNILIGIQEVVHIKSASKGCFSR